MAKTTKKSSKQIQILRGMKDVLPEDAPLWNALRSFVYDLAANYSFNELQMPILEEKNLFVRGVGEETDIVSKEMFAFNDHGDNVVLRPEFTASFARAYIEHGMINRPQPVKLFQVGPAFRRERPQAGRQRQFTQADFEIIGDDSPMMDAEMIALSYGLCQDLRIDVEVHVNSIGDKTSRKEYVKTLVKYLKPHKSDLCAHCLKRLDKNPLRVLDCKKKTCRDILDEAPEIVDYLDDASRKHFVEVLESLDAAEIPYSLDSRLVRGLDYYNRTVFEIMPVSDNAAQSTLIAGGRYDGLIKALGGRDVAAVGMAAGMERLILQLRNNDRFEITKRQPDVYVAQLGDRARRKGLFFLEHLRRNGFSTAHNFSSNGLGDQLGHASKLGVRYALVLGQKEIMDDTVMIRDMENGSQEVVDSAKIIQDLKKRLKK